MSTPSNENAKGHSPLDRLAREYGVIFNGLQHGTHGRVYPLFTHPEFGTFAMLPDETLGDSIERKRIQFTSHT